MSVLTLYVGLIAMFFGPTEEIAVRQLFSDREAAWEKQDVAELVDEFAEDADYIDSSGTLTTGRKAIEENYKKLFGSAKYKGSRSTQEIKKIRFIHEDVAVVDAEWSLSGLVAPDGKALPDRSGTSVVVVVKESDKWKIVTMRVALSAPKAAEAK